MTNWLNPKNMKSYIRHLKEIDERVEKQIQKDLKTERTPQYIHEQRQRKYLKHLVLPE